MLTLWIYFQGYKVITGQMRESLMGLVANMAKAAFIVSCAVAFGTVGSEIRTYLAHDMKDGINEQRRATSNGRGKVDESLLLIGLPVSLKSGVKRLRPTL